MPCVYLNEPTGRSLPSGEPVHACQVHHECVQVGGGPDIAACDTCKQNLEISAPEFSKQWMDPLLVFDRHQESAGVLRNLLMGRAVFLACGGPSANDLPLERLYERGTWTMAVNNMGGHSRFRPQAFVCTDPPSKFSSAIWLDPAIMKFVPTPKLLKGRRNIRRKVNGVFEQLILNGREIRTVECPNVWGVARRKWLAIDDTFFLDSEAPAGNFNDGVRLTGEPKTICTMLFAMRILRYLGASKVFLIGADFGMDPTKGETENYAFGEVRTPGNCWDNNRQYVIVNDWLCRLQQQETFTRFGIEFYNCNQFSGLRAFPYVSFQQAMEIVTEGVDKAPDLKGWYVK